MKLIVITGPSGSGKSYLSYRLSKIFNNSIVIKTDSYYRDNILIKFLSIFVYDIYDRLLSIKKNELKMTIKSIKNKNKLISFYKYDFERKLSSQSNSLIKYNEDDQCLILEGIFAHRLDLNYQETINIICEEQKDICFNRRLKRDQLERGRNSIEVIKRFNKSWYLFYKNIKNYLHNTKVLFINTQDEISYNKLILQIQKVKK